MYSSFAETRCAVRIALGTLLTVVAVGPAAAQSNLLVNGGFEDMPKWGAGIGGNAGFTLLTGASIPGWTIQDGYAATIHNPVAYPTISGVYSLNTDAEGYNGHNVNMYQDFASGAGTPMTLTFDWMNWFQSTAPLLNVSVVDTVSNAVLLDLSFGISPGVHSELYNFFGTGNALRLRIQHKPESGFNDNTFIVDNFKVVPAPGAAAALGLGAALVGRRRRS